MTALDRLERDGVIDPSLVIVAASTAEDPTGSRLSPVSRAETRYPKTVIED